METKEAGREATVMTKDEEKGVEELRKGWKSDSGGHPVLTLSDTELESIFRGVDPTASNGNTGTNATEFPKFCCDGTRVCCDD